MTRRELKDYKRRLNNVKKYIKKNNPEKYEEFSNLVNSFTSNISCRILGDWLLDNYGSDINNEETVTIHKIYLELPEEKIKNALDIHHKQLVKKRS